MVDLYFDTIAAIATPLGIGGVGIVRLSGPEALAIAAGVLRRRAGDGAGEPLSLADVPSHTAHYGLVVRPGSDEILDEVLALVMRAPRTFTGEEVVELQGHGGPLVLQCVLQAVLQAGARLARPGEFTQRAFLHGRLDLTQAEAVLDVIHSKTGAGLRAANEQLMGHLARPIEALRQRLIWLQARLEAAIDYPDEIDDLPAAEMAGLLAAARAEIERLLATAAAGRIWREGVPLAIVGRPNVGKSSLLNALLRQDRAIVTDIPGTTRDLVSEATALGGIPVKLVDTAGIRSSQDLVETLGIERTYQAMADADLTLIVIDVSDPHPEDGALVARAPSRLVVYNKSDLYPNAHGLAVSALTGEGIP
ncbi:MAG: tRNA uridine-5-carboxymethylaminomethyl(34) synthesis GTPase MnmE, partial [Nevskia sp.]|nr:tRNA uridine-5-carboxymethylaminomethyl(34) synthesis GTPase MnmE [Nevskia sp.]